MNSILVYDETRSKMPRQSKRAAHLSTIRKTTKKRVVLTTNGSVSNVSRNGGDGSALQGEHTVCTKCTL